MQLTRGEFNVLFPPNKQIEADWTIAGIKNCIDQLLADSEIDVVITLGLISGNEVCHRKNLSKPVIAPYVLDAKFQELPVKNGAIGVKNLCYIIVPLSFRQDMQTFQEIVSFKKLAILMNQS